MSSPSRSLTASFRFRTVLAERFNLRVHTEDRLTSVFLLQVARNGPKLLPPDPNSAHPTGCFSSAPLVCHNVTLETLARALRSNRTGIEIQVLNETGIEGRYDLKLEYALDKNGYVGADTSIPTPDASEGPTIFNALDHFGLKLQNVKRPMPVIVIDRVEQFVAEK